MHTHNLKPPNTDISRLKVFYAHQHPHCVYFIFSFQTNGFPYFAFAFLISDSILPGISGNAQQIDRFFYSWCAQFTTDLVVSISCCHLLNGGKRIYKMESNELYLFVTQEIKHCEWIKVHAQIYLY